MSRRAPVLRRLGLLSLVAALGCKPDPATATEDPEPSPDASASVGTPDPAEGTEEPEDPTSGELAAAAVGGEDSGAESGAGGEDSGAASGEGVGGDQTEPETTPVAAKTDESEDEREPLPKPIHKLSGPKCQKKFAVGGKVKGFKLPSVKGDKNISPGGYRNRVMLLNFWGTWCKPCLKELPEFDRLYRKYRKHGMTLVAVATDEDPEPVQAFIDKHKLRAKVALEGEDAAGAYNRPNFPFSFVVSKGKIVAAYEYIDDACMGDLEQVIRDELEKL